MPKPNNILDYLIRLDKLFWRAANRMNRRNNKYSLNSVEDNDAIKLCDKIANERRFLMRDINKFSGPTRADDYGHILSPSMKEYGPRLDTLIITNPLDFAGNDDVESNYVKRKALRLISGEE